MKLIKNFKGIDGDFISIYKISDGKIISVNDRTGKVIGSDHNINQIPIDKGKLQDILNTLISCKEEIAMNLSIEKESYSTEYIKNELLPQINNSIQFIKTCL